MREFLAGWAPGGAGRGGRPGGGGGSGRAAAGAPPAAAGATATASMPWLPPWAKRGKPGEGKGKEKKAPTASPPRRPMQQQQPFPTEISSYQPVLDEDVQAHLDFYLAQKTLQEAMQARGAGAGPAAAADLTPEHIQGPPDARRPSPPRRETRHSLKLDSDMKLVHRARRKRLELDFAIDEGQTGKALRLLDEMHINQLSADLTPLWRALIVSKKRKVTHEDADLVEAMLLRGADPTMRGPFKLAAKDHLERHPPRKEEAGVHGRLKKLVRKALEERRWLLVEAEGGRLRGVQPFGEDPAKAVQTDPIRYVDIGELSAVVECTRRHATRRAEALLAKTTLRGWRDVVHAHRAVMRRVVADWRKSLLEKAFRRWEEKLDKRRVMERAVARWADGLRARALRQWKVFTGAQREFWGGYMAGHRADYLLGKVFASWRLHADSDASVFAQALGAIRRAEHLGPPHAGAARAGVVEAF